MNLVKKGSGWRKLWENKTTPWDLGDTTPALKWFLKEFPSYPTNLDNAIVPGCGSGWDLSLIATLCPKITALDISPLAIERAREINQNYNLIDYVVGDFFDFKSNKDKEQYSLV